MPEFEATVFLVDDDADIRKSLARALRMRGLQVEVFASALEFLEVYDSIRPGCLVLDQGMPNMTGLELQELLVAKGYQIPIIFITGHGGVPQSVQAMKAGAIDFLEKPFRQDVLIDRIAEAFKTDAQARFRDNTTSEAHRRYMNLTDREQEIARFLASHPSENSSKIVARSLGISPRTVDHHRARVLEKMGVGSVAELIEISIRSGLPLD